MLEKKLRQASAENAKHRRRFALMLGVAVLACAAVVVVISSMDFSPTPANPQKAVATATSDETLPQVDQLGLRERFMQDLQIYEQELEPALGAANLKDWNAKAELEIATLKDAAVTSFSTGDYAAALKSLSDLDVLGRQVLTEQDTLFSAQLTSAKEALAKGDFDTGKLHISKARLVKSNDQEAKDIEAQVDALPQIVALLKKADIARTENNMEKEYAALVQALKIDPSRDGLKERAAALAKKLKESRFSALISRGLANVKKRALGAARSNAQKAGTIYSGRSELQVLNDAIIKLAHELDLERAVSQGEAAMAQDDWPLAQSIYVDALTRHANDNTLQGGLEISSKVVGLKKSLDDFIRRPERLASPNVFAGAKEQLILADALSRISKSLALQATELKHLLSQMNVKVSVVVRSDNLTQVRVKGVGKVGVTMEKTIQLKPGNYTFEGIRDGYKSKLVAVRIPPGTSMIEVEVVCDEPI